MEVASEMVQRFVDFGGTRVDTARIYAGGDTEPIVGSACRPFQSGLTMGSKAHPSQRGGLSSDGMRSQLQASLDALGCVSVDEFYLHQPDPDRPLSESLRCADALVREGLVRSSALPPDLNQQWGAPR